eukprot:GEMP01012354.1.p1 GENE.GEMP01012354.1~~GEMP01012354.1.p1  ORF type:complete len:716 (+),score=142.01 GEMP01012354.1:257-2149(+)
MRQPPCSPSYSSWLNSTAASRSLRPLTVTLAQSSMRRHFSSSPKDSSHFLVDSNGTKSVTKARLKKALKWSGEKTLQGLRWTWWLTKKTMKLLVAFLKDPKVVRIWAADLKEALNHMIKWTTTGFRLFGANVKISSKLATHSLKGHALTLRERKLLIRTTSDIFKIIPFSFFIIIPFAELLLPVFIRIFPNMLPSTFFESSYDTATLSRKLKAKQELASFFQEVVARRTKQILKEEDHADYDRQMELAAFQEKLKEGSEFPSAKELLRFSKMFKNEFRFDNMDTDHLSAMCRMLGINPMHFHAQVVLQLRHHVTGLRKEDRELLWEGLDSLSDEELVEYCKARAIRFDVSNEKMREWLGYWLELSSHKDINISLLLWCQTFFIASDEYKIALAVDSSRVAQEKPEKQEQKKEEDEPSLAFSKMKERRQTRLIEAEEHLLELNQCLETIQGNEKTESAETHDIVKEVKPKPVDSSCDYAEVDTLDEDLHNYSALEVTQLGKSALFEEVFLLEEQRATAVKIVQKQHLLLKKQLEFLSQMRTNEPTVNKDPDRILFDQRARLVGMFNKFSNDFKTVEEEIDNLTARTVAGRSKLVLASLKRLAQPTLDSDGSVIEEPIVLKRQEKKAYGSNS